MIPGRRARAAGAAAPTAPAAQLAVAGVGPPIAAVRPRRRTA